MKELKDGLGIWQLLNSTIVSDIISKSGFDYALIDLEHGFFNINSIQNCVLASKATKLKKLLSDFISYEEIVRVIDTDIDGILFPHIEIQKDLEIIVKKLLPPIGEKVYLLVPKYDYGLKEGFQNTNLILGILVESSNGIRNLSNLLSNQIIDFVYFGAYDLSVEYQIPGQIFDQRILENLKDSKECNKIFKKNYVNLGQKKSWKF